VAVVEFCVGFCSVESMEEEGDIYDGVRAQFPLSFGKQSKPQTPLEAIHNATRRSTSTSNPNSKTTDQLPSLSSSSREWLNSLRPSKNPIPPPPPDHDDAPLVGPPPPPPAASDDEDGDGDMIGPPPPPRNASESEDDSDEDEVGTRFRIPLSNEIVLKGHTKVFLPQINESDIYFDF